MKNGFPRVGRWDSVGLDCSYCLHFRGPARWPDARRESSCDRHRVSLAVEIGADGYKDGEWFCSAFVDSGRSVQAAVGHFLRIRDSLDPGILYGLYGSDGNFQECRLSDLPAMHPPPERGR